MLAATARLVSSAINATFSPERTPRHVSTALRAPGISSGSGAPKLMQISVLESQRFSNPVIVRWLLSNCREDGAKPADASNARGHVFGLTQNAGTCPPPLVTLASPVELSRVRNPQSFPRNKYGAKSTSISR